MAYKSAISVGLLYIPKEQGMTSLVLAKYDDENRLHIVTHVTLGVSRAKMKLYYICYEGCG